MERTMRPRPILAALAAILAGFTLGATAFTVSGSQPFPAMPGSSCPPEC